MKLSHALEGFWLSKRLDFSAATVQNYEGVFRQFLAYLGNREIEAITSDDIRRYLDYLHKRRKLSKRSVHSQWAILSSFWTWAESELHIAHIIRGHVPAPSYRKRAIIPFTQDEIKRLLDAAAYSKPWRASYPRPWQPRRLSSGMGHAARSICPAPPHYRL